MTTLESLQEKYDNVDESDLGASIQTFEEIMNHDDMTESGLKLREKSIYRLGKIYADKKLVEELISLTKSILPLLKDIPQKSKTAKIIRTLFDFTSSLTGSELQLVDLCHHAVEWCNENKRSFLRHKIQTKLSNLYFKLERYQEALEMLANLLFEIKKMDDK
jgi:26S proteasome regulatory subunit N6